MKTTPNLYDCEELQLITQMAYAASEKSKTLLAVAGSLNDGTEASISLKSQIGKLDVMMAKAQHMISELMPADGAAGTMGVIELAIGQPYRVLQAGHRLDGCRVIIDTIVKPSGKPPRVFVVVNPVEVAEVPVGSLVACK